MYKLKIVELPKPLNIKTQVNFPEVVLGKMQEKTVKPKTTFQEILPDKNYDGLSKVNVEAVTNEIDENIKSENIKKDISILGVQGNIEELKGTKIEITKNGTYTPEEPYNAYTEVEANVEADVSEYFGNTITAGVSGTPGLVKIIKKIPLLIIEGNSCSNMFNVYNIGLVELPKLDTSNCIQAINMCSNCTNLETIPLLDFSKMATLGSTFYNCKALTNLGGFQNLGQAYLTTAKANYGSYKLELLESTKLTHDSLMNVINNLYDIATKGVKTQQLQIGSTNISKLSAEEIAIATNKGFSVS